MRYTELEKNCTKSTEGFTQVYTLAIMGTGATQHFAKAVQGYAYQEGIALTVFDADYNQIDAQVMDTTSELYQMEPEFTLFWLCTEKLYEEFCQSTQRSAFAETVIKRLEHYWDCVNAGYHTTILQCNFLQLDDGVFGNYGNKTADAFIFQLRKLNYLLMEKCSEYKNVFIIDLLYLQEKYGADMLRDNKMYDIAKLPVSTKQLPKAAKQVVDVIKAVKGNLKKCIILDLDNTLWGGVIGDDGIEHIAVTVRGVAIVPGENMENYIGALGEPDELTGVPSCIEEGDDKTYTYGGVLIYTYRANGTDQINLIEITGTEPLGKGIHIGDTEETVIAAYGDAYTMDGDELLYELNDKVIGLRITDGKVTFMELFTR